jgi:nitrite transporter NirC
MSDVSRKKVDYLLHSPGGYFILSALAGIYLGFGVCLTLVIFAGSELFTGNTMVCTIGAFSRVIAWKYVGWIFVWSFLGNLVGSLAVAWLAAQSGVVAQAPQMDLFLNVAEVKMSVPAWELFSRVMKAIISPEDFFARS